MCGSKQRWFAGVVRVSVNPAAVGAVAATNSHHSTKNLEF